MRQSGMRRRTFRQLRSAPEKGPHHHVYVVLLDAKALQEAKLLRDNPHRNPNKPCVYVGMTGLTPDERLLNHRKGVKSSRIVEQYGVRLMPELFAWLNPMPFDAAVQMERDLAEDLRMQGYTVAGGH
jgi:hypothetical protein